MPKPSKKLIEETQALVRLKFFLVDEVGIKKDLSLRELRAAAVALRRNKIA